MATISSLNPLKTAHKNLKEAQEKFNEEYDKVSNVLKELGIKSSVRIESVTITSVTSSDDECDSNYRKWNKGDIVEDCNGNRAVVIELDLPDPRESVKVLHNSSSCLVAVEWISANQASAMRRVGNALTA